ncbi:MAG: MFS transporter [Candidatus Obscuribacterales bacterium]|nr:MFS transporter [Candidatus Obscuribacterales bacterium]
MTNQVKASENPAKPGKMALLLIFLTVFIDLVGFGIIIPVLPTYAEKFGANATLVGLLLASYSLMQFFFTPFWGRLSDKVGRRPILLTSLLASAIGYLIWGVSASLPMLFLSRLVAGFGNANLAVAQAYISDVTTEENRAKGMGLIGAAFGLGFVLGPAIGGLASPFGLNTIGYLAAACSIIDLVLTFFLLPEPETRSQAAHERYSVEPNFYWNTLRNDKLKASLLIFFISTFAFANMEATLVLLTEKQFHFSAAQNAWMFFFIGIIMVFVQGGLIGRLSKRFGEKKLIVAGSILVAAGLLLTPATTSVPVLYAALFLLALGSGINTPSNQSMLSRLSDKGKVGGIMGVGQSLSTLGRILGPIAGGFAFEHLGLGAPYLIGAATMLVVAGLGFTLPDLKPNGSDSNGKKKTPDNAAVV